jgi:hypothetical protein
MNLQRTPTAFFLTAIWILGGLCYAYSMHDAFLGMTPQEFAEFLAGAFSPLAFLWLIVGYMQQGEELRQNTQALTQQAEELRHSAEQQRLLVEVTREQLAEERINIAHERERIKAAAEPLFLIGTMGNLAPRQVEFPIRVANSGGPARSLSLVLVTPEGAESRLFTVPLLDTGATHDFNLPLAVVQRDKLRFTYRDMYGSRGTKNFTVTIGAGNTLLFARAEG